MQATRAFRILLLLLILPGANRCMVSSALSAVKDTPKGSASFHPADGASADFAPVRCASGERELFFGADFVDASGRTVRLVVDPLGNATLRIFAAADPLTPGLIFRRDECETFHLATGRTGWEINDVYDLAVRLEFSCRNAAGASASGTLSSEHCH